MTDYFNFIDEKPEIAGLAVLLFVMAVSTIGITLPWSNVCALAFGCLTLVGSRYYRGVSLGRFGVSETAGPEEDSHDGG